MSVEKPWSRAASMAETVAAVAAETGLLELTFFRLAEALGGDEWHERLQHARATGCLELRFIQDVSVDAATAVKKVLVLLPQLTEFHLQANRLPIEPAYILAKQLTFFSETLVTLNLRLTDLSGHAARALANMLPTLSALTSLKIFVNRIDATGAVLVAYKLSDLWYLSDNDVGPVGARALGKPLSTKTGV
jgi:hypothetical protein